VAKKPMRTACSRFAQQMRQPRNISPDIVRHDLKVFFITGTSLRFFPIHSSKIIKKQQFTHPLPIHLRHISGLGELLRVTRKETHL
jgi:hypothetical protein